MEENIEQLVREKGDLEARNAEIIDENRALLDQLEGLNSQVSDAEAHTKSLTATLHATSEELQRLTVLAGRAADLETQLAQFEVDQAKLQADLASKKENSQSMIQRWKQAEGTIGLLQEQIDRIEEEAKEERRRHVEIVGRMERRRTVEKELHSAAGRLKGAAASKSLHQGGGTNVVSHFVKDILQDNANLQMGVVELREMLLSSNAEIEKLREQLVLHQPLSNPEELRRNSLHTELRSAESKEEEPSGEQLPELHVHHHYHRSERTIRKPRRKRVSLGAHPFSPSHSGASTPRDGHIKEWQLGPTPTSATAILSQTLATVPNSKRFSAQSSQTLSTLASSSVPTSPSQAPTVFDHFDVVFDSSRPTSPDSSFTGSPPARFEDFGLPRIGAHRTVSSPITRRGEKLPQFQRESRPVSEDHLVSSLRPDAARSSSTTDRPTLRVPRSSRVSSTELMSPLGHEIIPEEPDEARPPEGTTSPSDDAYPSSPSLFNDLSPALRRRGSSDSLLSIAGMDIHTPLRPRASQVFTNRGIAPSTSYSPSTAEATASATIITPTSASAAAPHPLRHQSSGEYTRALLSRQSSRPSLGKRVGGWMWGKWGVPSPTTPTTSLEQSLIGRPPGVNQSGRVKGLMPPKKAPTCVEPERIDEDALKEGLAE